MPALCLHTVSGTGLSLAASLFVAGLTGGFTHCAGMCGPFVLAQGAPCSGPQQTRLERLKAVALLPYHLGRTTTYVGMAYLFSSFVSFVFLDSQIKMVLSSFFLALAGLVFLVNAIPALAAVFPWLQRIPAPVPFRLIQKLSAPLAGKQGFLNRYALGVLLGFMPCGLVMAALLASAAATTPLESSLAMGAFAAGTVPALVIVAAGGQTVKHLWPSAAPLLSALLVLVSGVSLIYIAGTLIL